MTGFPLRFLSRSLCRKRRLSPESLNRRRAQHCLRASHLAVLRRQPFSMLSEQLSPAVFFLETASAWGSDSVEVTISEKFSGSEMGTALVLSPASELVLESVLASESASGSEPVIRCRSSQRLARPVGGPPQAGLVPLLVRVSARRAYFRSVL